jgi:hypothetical protein
MALISSLLVLPIPHNLSNDEANRLHFAECESVAASKVTWGTRWGNIPFCVRKFVINSVKSSRGLNGAAVNARFADQLVNLGSRHVAGVDSGVSLSQKHGAAFVGAPIPPLALHVFLSLLRRVFCPSIRTIVAASFADAVTASALIGKTQRATFVAQEMFSGCGENHPAPMALTFSSGVARVYMHDRIIPYGPHFELDRLAYP